MKKGILTGLAIVFFWSAQAQTVDSNFVDGWIWAKVPDTSSLVLDINHPLLTTIVATYGVDTIFQPYTGLSSDTLDKTSRIGFSNISQVNQLIADLELLPIIDYAEKVPIHRSSHVPNDLDPTQVYLTQINAQQAWDVGKGNPNIVIAIVDNGTLITHEDLAPNLWVNTGEIPNNGFDDDLNGYTDDVHGFDLADRDGNPNPPPNTTNGSAFVHGTHVAGIAAAATNNGKGVASIGYGCSIMAIKVTPDDTDGKILTNSLDGVVYAVRNGADVINMSYGSTGSSFTEANIMNTANANGVVLVAAAGNEGSTTPQFPASYDGVISVGSVSGLDVRSGFSNHGSTVDIMAPGEQLFSCLAGSNSSYGQRSGTSMASPVVAGLVGLLLSENPGFTPAQVEQRLKANAVDISLQNPGEQVGAGRIDAFKTMDPNGIVIPPLGVEEAGELGITFSPNPMGDQLYIQLPGKIEQATINLYNTAGELVRNIQLHQSANISVSTLPAGIYLAEIRVGEQRVFQKLVKYVHN